MRKTMLLVTICTLSACGLFKKTSKDIAKHEQSETSEIVKQTNIGFQDQSMTLEVNTSLTNEVFVNGYTIKADAIKFHSDGSFEANGNVNMTGKNDWQKNTKDSVAKFLQSNIDYSEIANERTKNEVSQKDYSMQTKSETDGWGVVFGSVSFLLIVFGVLWWFGIRRSK